MENTKKMILIEPEVIEKLKKENYNGSFNNLSNLDEEMHKVLSTKLEDREKCSLYLQILQRYLYFVGKDRKPLQLPIISFDETKDTKKDDVKSEMLDHKDILIKTDGPSSDVSDASKKIQLLQLLPKSYKTKGELLVDILLKNKDKIYWNKNGTVFIDNKEVVNSNIVDLLGDVVRPLKNSSPVGWAHFALALKDLQVPLSYIGNPRRATYINVIKNSPNQMLKTNKSKVESLTSPEYSTPRSSQPVAKHKTNKKIDWERWTPY